MNVKRVLNVKSPFEIIENFFNNHTSFKQEQEQLDKLFRLIQYVERQVVLFDAPEDAAFTDVRDVSGAGTFIKTTGAGSTAKQKEKQLAKNCRIFL